MGVDRTILIRIVTNNEYFSDIIKLLVQDNKYNFNVHGSVSSLGIDDIDEYDFILYKSFEELVDILNSRESKGIPNYLTIWDNDIQDSLLIRCIKLDTVYRDFTNHYELHISIGHGVRIEGAERYTNFGVYINKLIPIFIKNSMYVCEINCCDIDS